MQQGDNGNTYPNTKGDGYATTSFCSLQTREKRTSAHLLDAGSDTAPAGH